MIIKDLLIRTSRVLCLLLLGLLLPVMLAHSTTGNGFDCSQVSGDGACIQYIFFGNTDHMEFSPNDHTVAFVARNLMASIVSVPSGELLKTFGGYRGYGYSLSYAPDGNTIAISTEYGVSLWNLEDDSKEYIDTEVEVMGIDYSPDGRMLALGMIDGTIMLIDVESKEVLATAVDNNYPFFSAVSSIAFSPTDNVIATGSHAGVRLWSVPDLTMLDQLIDIDANVDFSGNGEYLSAAVRLQTEVPIWHMENGEATLAQVIPQANGDLAGATHAVLSYDGSTVAISASVYLTRSPALRIWSVADGTVLLSITQI